MAASVTGIETHGVERIPDEDRTARPVDQFRLAYGDTPLAPVGLDLPPYARDQELRMSTTTVQEVRAAADALVAAFAEGRLDDYFGAFAPDATFVFHTTPERLGSTAEYRALWQRWVERDGFRVLGCVSSAQLIQNFGDTAVFSHDVETRVATHAGEETVHERETIVFTRADTGGWTAVHEHLSARTTA